MQTESNEAQLPNDSELQFPTGYATIDEEFLKKYKPVIEQAKERYKSTGGVMMLEVGSRAIIVRTPSDHIVKDIRKRSEQKKLDPMDSDRMLVKKCLLYPSEAVLDRWMGEDGKVGICSAFGSSMMREAELARTADAKKL